MSVFCTGSCAPNLPIVVTITGSGNSSNCYAIINGTKYYTETNNIKVMAGDTISFETYNNVSSTQSGFVKINGTQVTSSTTKGYITYDWTVSDGISNITIAITYYSSSGSGQIIVTTS